MGCCKTHATKIVAVVLKVSCIIAIALFEAGLYFEVEEVLHLKERGRGLYPEANTYEALVVITLILAIIIQFMCCCEQAKSRTYIVFGIAALLMDVGIIAFGVHLGQVRALNSQSLKANVDGKINFNSWQFKDMAYGIASMIFAGFGFLTALFGAIAPFTHKLRDTNGA